MRRRRSRHDQPRQSDLNAQLGAGRHVSILVAVDRPRQRDLDGLHHGPSSWGFNPCCGGSASSTSLGHQYPPVNARFQSLLRWIGLVNTSLASLTTAIQTGFQSLLRWIGLVNPNGATAEAQVIQWFQSLLRWIGLVNGRERCVSMHHDTVSILVAVDRPRQPSLASLTTAIQTGFQSLLRWIGLVNRTVPALPGLRIAGFNPCCGGSASSTTPRV